jgi:hypothetical protein
MIVQTLHASREWRSPRTPRVISTEHTMKPQDQGDEPVISIRAHPSERRQVRALARGEVAAFCCCCCCCLHTLGSLAGAVFGSFYRLETEIPAEKLPSAKLRDDEIDGPPREVPIKSPVSSIYWLTTLGVSVLVSLYVIARSGPDGIVGVLFVLALCMPAVQLGGSLLSLFIVGANPDANRDGTAWKRLGCITLGSVLGAALGLFIMWAMVTRR